MDIAGRENTILGSDRQVGGEDEAEAEAGRRTVRRSDNRLRHVPQRDQQRVQPIDDRMKGLLTGRGLERDQFAEHIDVAAGAEMRTRAAQQHDASRGILGGFGRRRSELADHLAVGGVEHRRPIQDDLQNGPAPLHDNTRHRSAPSTLRSIIRGTLWETIPWPFRSCAAAACSTSSPEPRNPPISWSRTTRSERSVRPAARPRQTRSRSRRLAGYCIRGSSTPTRTATATLRKGWAT